MKKSLLGILLLGAFAGNAQTYLQSYTNYYYDDLGDVTNADSTSYSYHAGIGGIFNNEPTFGITADNLIPIWNYERLVPNFYVGDNWYDSGAGMQQGEIYTRTHNGLSQPILEETQSGWNKTEFTYALNGQIASETDFYYDGFTWTENNKSEYAYDLNNRLVEIKSHYDDGNGYHLAAIDTIEYEDIWGLVTEVRTWNSTDGVNFDITARTEVYATAGEYDYIHHYEDDDSDPQSPIVWQFYGDYVWNGSDLESFSIYFVENGVPDMSTPFGVLNYTYGGGKLASILTETIFGEEKVEFSYNGDGLLDVVQSFEMDNLDQWYVAQEETYYYDVTVGVNESSIADLNVYPNPAVNVVNIQTDAEIIEVKLVTMTGQLIIAQKGNLKEVDMSSIASGNYLLLVTTTDGTSTMQITK